MTPEQNVPPVDYGSGSETSAPRTGTVAVPEKAAEKPAPPPTKKTQLADTTPNITLSVPAPDIVTPLTAGIVTGALIVPLALLSVLLWKRLWSRARNTPGENDRIRSDEAMTQSTASKQSCPAAIHANMSEADLVARLGDELTRARELVELLSGMLSHVDRHSETINATRDAVSALPHATRTEAEIKQRLRELGQQGTQLARTSAFEFNEFLNANRVTLFKLAENGALEPLRNDAPRNSQDLWAVPDSGGSGILAIFLGFGIWNSAEYYRSNPHNFKQRVAGLFNVSVSGGVLSLAEPAFIRQTNGNYAVLEKGRINL